MKTDKEIDRLRRRRYEKARRRALDQLARDFPVQFRKLADRYLYEICRELEEYETR